jgi:hypothetical protein
MQLLDPPRRTAALPPLEQVPLVSRLSRATRAGVALTALAAASAAAGLASLTSRSPAGIDGYGLISAVGPGYLLAVSLIVVVIVVSLSRRSLPARYLTVQIALLATVLAAAPGLLEPYPRFSTAWVHAGFTDYIGRTGHLLPGYDARFSWPGFFAAAAAFSGAVGLPPLALVRWAPVVLDLLYLLPLTVVLRQLVASPRQRALALVLFVVGNWIGQDYFAPQGINFLLYLSAVAVLLAVFAGEPGGWLWRLLGRLLLRARGGVARLPGRQTVGPGQRTTTMAFLLLMTICAASLVSHQLTPVFLIITAVVLVLLRATRLRGLPVLLAVAMAAYIVWGAQDYWAGHLDEMVEGFGAVGSSIEVNAVDRLTAPASAARQAVVGIRVAIPIVYVALAGLGLLRDRSRALVLPAALAAAPLSVLAMQSYGGEAILRAQLFALPFLSILAAHVWRPGRRGPDGWLVTRVVAGAALVALTGVCFIARYGNEDFEQMRAVDVHAVQELYELAPSGSDLYSLNSSVPWRDQRIDSYQFHTLEHPPWEPGGVERSLEGLDRAKGPAFLLVTEGQWAEARQMSALDETRIADVTRELDHSPRLRAVYRDGSATIYRYVGGQP